MKILYLSVHSILEYDEMKLFTEMGHEVYSVQGSYVNPNAPIDGKRPAFKGKEYDQLNAVSMQCSKEDLHQELVDWADVVYIMHKPEWLIKNWGKLHNKKVIWRSIGQSTPDIENQLIIPRMQGMKIVRYSPAEQKIRGYAGHSAIIRFYKDPEEFKDWTGEIDGVLNITQAMMKRGKSCGYDIFKDTTEGLRRALYGTQSLYDDGTPMPDPLWKAQLTYDELKDAYRKHRVYLYTGTYPASYTLNFMEAWMTGIPVVAIGQQLADINAISGAYQYEVLDLIVNGENGYLSDSLPELRSYVEKLLKDPKEAKRIGENGRKRAIELFGRETIKNQWEVFFNEL